MKRVLVWFGAGVLLLLVLAATSVAYALSHHGLNTLAQWGLRKYNANIVGQVAVTDVQRHGTAIHLLGVSVRYQGVVVAQVDAVKVQPNWKTLRPNNIHLRTFDVLRPALILEKHASDGKFTIAKAFEPRKVKAQKQAEAKPSQTPIVRVERLHVAGAQIRYVGQPQEIAVGNLDVDLHAVVAWPRIDALDVKVTGQLEKPERLPFRLLASAEGLAPLGLNAKLKFALDSGVVQGIAIKDVALDAIVKEGIATISHLQANVDGNQLTVSGRAGPWQTENTPFSLHAAVALTDLAHTASRVRSFGMVVPPLAGAGTLSIDAAGSPVAPLIKATAAFSGLQVATVRVQRLNLSPIAGGGLLNEHRLVLQGLRFDKQALGTVTVQAGLSSPQTVKGQLSVQHPTANVQARYEFPLLALKANNTLPTPVRLEVSAAVPSVRKAARAFAVAAPNADGNVSANVDIRGLFGGASFPDIRVMVDARSLRAGAQAVGDVMATASIPAGQSIDAAVELKNPQAAKRSSVRLRGRWRRPLDVRNADAWRAAIMRMTYDASIDIEGANLAALKAIVEPAVPPQSLAALEGLQGSAALQGHATGSLTTVKGKVSLLVDHARTNKLPATNVNLQSEITASDAKLSLRVDTVGKGQEARLLLLTAQGKPTAPRMLDPQAWKRANVQWQAEIGPLRMQQIQALSPQTSQFAMERVQGRFHALVQGKGTLPMPNVNAELSVSQIKRGDRALGDIQIKARYEKMIPTLVAHLTSANGGTLKVNAQTTRPLPLSPLPVREALPPVNLDVAASQFNLALFDGWVETLRGVGGVMEGHLNVGGTMASPKFEGNLSVKNGSLEIVEVARLEDIDVRMKAAPGELILEAFNFESGAGRGELTARLTRTGRDAMALRGDLKLRRFPLQAPQRKLGELDLSTNWTGSVTLAKLTIDPLRISEARVYLEHAKPKALQDLKRPDDVVLFDGGNPATKTERKKFDQLIAKEAPVQDVPIGAPTAAPILPSFASYPVFVRVKAPRNLWVRSNDGSMELGLSEKFTVQKEDNLRVYGSVFVRRGRVSVLGRAFDIRNTSEVRFMGDPGNPELDAVVDHHNKQENVQIVITIKGKADNLNVKFTSLPPLPQTDIISLLVTGRRQPMGGGASSGSEPQEQAAALAGGLLASKLRGTILRRLPVDVLSISANAIEAGSYVTDRLYVGYIRRLLAQPWRYENQNALHLEYQFSPRWSFEGEYGDVGSGSGDLVWKKNY